MYKNISILFKKNHNLLIAILIIVFCFSCFIIINKNDSSNNKILNKYSGIKNNLKQIRQNRHIVESRDIQSWMTFSYINFVFKLPKEYLENSLNIKDQKYPKISIQKYTEIHKMNTNDFVSQIKILIENYNSTSTNTVIK